MFITFFSISCIFMTIKLYMLEKIYKDHKKWINTVKKFGCTKQQAEDIVGEMYINIAIMLKKGLDITYGDDVNYFYIYRALRNIYINFKHKQVKQHNVSIDLVLDLESQEYIDYDLADKKLSKELEICIGTIKKYSTLSKTNTPLQNYQTKQALHIILYITHTERQKPN